MGERAPVREGRGPELSRRVAHLAGRAGRADRGRDARDVVARVQSQDAVAIARVPVGEMTAAAQGTPRCELCRGAAASVQPSGDAFDVSCLRCGNYRVSGSALTQLEAGN